MGLFGGKKVYVASSVWNLAGDEAHRPSYLKTMVVGGVLTNTPDQSLADSVQTGLMSGPGIKLRQYFRWCETHFNGPMGITSDGLASTPSIDTAAVAAQIAPPDGSTITVQSVSFGIADFEVWAEQWMLVNHPDLFNGDWLSNYDEATGLVSVTLPDTSVHTFTPTDFVKTAFYIYAVYNPVSDGSQARVYIYKIGSGNADLDATVSSITGVGGFFSPIPIRFNGQFLSDTFSPIEYGLSQKAYKKLTGGSSYDDLVTTLAANDKISDMNYIFAFPGVSLNVQENACRKYIYKFFANCMATQLITSAEYAAWLSSSTDAAAANATWVTWYEAQTSPLNPLYGTPEPPRPAFPNAGLNMVQIQSGSGVNFQVKIVWRSITEDEGVGLGKPDAVPGSVWLENGPVSSLDTQVLVGLGFASLANSLESIYVWWQVDANSWKRLTIVGMEHHNYVFEGHDVVTTAQDALADADESGFIVPIHWDTWRAMSLADTTQMATACVFLVVNSYKVVKLQWWQTGFFQVILFVAIVVVTILNPPVGAALLGTELGFTGLTALIIGVLLIDVVNVLTMMLLLKLIGMVSSVLFGDKIGTIIAAVAAVITLNVAQGLQNGLNLAETFTQLMNPMNLIQMTEAVGNGVVHMVQLSIQETAGKTQDVLSQYNQQSKAITDLYAQNIGYGNGVVDTSALVTASQWYPETSDTFLTRTLMTGSDIAEFSTTLISRFSDLTLSTDLPF